MDTKETIERLKEENKILKRRCAILTEEKICKYCHITCEFRDTEQMRKEDKDSE